MKMSPRLVLCGLGTVNRLSKCIPRKIWLVVPRWYYVSNTGADGFKRENVSSPESYCSTREETGS